VSETRSAGFNILCKIYFRDLFAQGLRAYKFCPPGEPVVVATTEIGTLVYWPGPPSVICVMSRGLKRDVVYLC
jgi:hypothetical protein